MFSTQEYLEKKTGPFGIGRLNYLESLVKEFQDSNNVYHKEQVLANLANFAYDPINYEFMRRVNVIDLFLDSLSDENETIVQYGIGGLCNICLDKENKEYILQNKETIQLVKRCLVSSNEETVVSAITTLMYLVTPRSKPEITQPSVIESMVLFSKCDNSRLKNLATVFLEDYCTKEQRRDFKMVKDTQDDK